MMNLLEKLRAKPVHVRKRIAFVTSVAVFGVIASVWWGGFTRVPVATSDESETKEVAFSEVISPLSALGKLFVDAKDGALGFAGKLQDQLQYDSGGGESRGTAAVGNSEPNNTNDVVYPDQVFPDQGREVSN